MFSSLIDHPSSALTAPLTDPLLRSIDRGHLPPRNSTCKYAMPVAWAEGVYEGSTPIEREKNNSQNNKKAVLSQGEPRDAAVNFDACQI